MLPDALDNLSANLWVFFPTDGGDKVRKHCMVGFDQTKERVLGVLSVAEVFEIIVRNFGWVVVRQDTILEETPVRHSLTYITQ
jgi:hypothetical protein